MELFANGLSICKQFHDIPSFRNALGQLMAMRNAARHFGQEVHCHRGLVNVEPISGVPMPQALGKLSVNEQRAAMKWLADRGPFWDTDDVRRHGPNDCLETRGRSVTGTAIGEAAYRKLHGAECGLVSATPSDWDFSPIEVTWKREDEDDRSAKLENWRDAAALKQRLHNAPTPFRSWADLQNTSMIRFGNLTFASNCFEPLTGLPFVKSSAERIFELLDILDQLARAFDATGARTPEGNRILQNHFAGSRAWFSDSSETEKHKFGEKLTFPHPDNPKHLLCCTWHGKIRYMKLRLRLHFSWPIQFGKPVYVVYVGPKLTKK